MVILEENLKWHLEAFASELFIYTVYIQYACKYLLNIYMHVCVFTYIQNNYTHYTHIY